jgi:hypothetical protein
MTTVIGFFNNVYHPSLIRSESTSIRISPPLRSAVNKHICLLERTVVSFPRQLLTLNVLRNDVFGLLPP